MKRKIAIITAILVTSVTLTGCSLSAERWQNIFHQFLIYIHEQLDEPDTVETHNTSGPLQVDDDFNFAEELEEGQAAGGLLP